MPTFAIAVRLLDGTIEVRTLRTYSAWHRLLLNEVPDFNRPRGVRYVFDWSVLKTSETVVFLLVLWINETYVPTGWTNFLDIPTTCMIGSHIPTPYMIGSWLLARDTCRSLTHWVNRILTAFNVGAQIAWMHVHGLSIDWMCKMLKRHSHTSCNFSAKIAGA